MALPLDVARCGGTAHPTCSSCVRMHRSYAPWTHWIQAPIDVLTGECAAALHVPTWASGTTVDSKPPNLELSRGGTAETERDGTTTPSAPT